MMSKLLFLPMLLLLAACGTPHTLQLQGLTMGTRYTIQIIAPPETLVLATLQADIEQVLNTINAQMSTYQSDSELSRINQNPSTDWLPISKALYQVLAAAQRISHLTAGAFDVTLQPMLTLWGFGTHAAVKKVPNAADIAVVRAYIGYEKLQLRATPPSLRKQHPRLAIDLSAIAKGYAVDQVSLLLNQHNIAHYLVEIGGELRARGLNAQQEIWKIGIETPSSNGTAKIVALNNQAMATSGDYRNYFMDNKQRYAHIFDPKTAAPVTHPLASVSVRHANCMLADAWATALLVMGTEQALILAKQENLSLFLIKRQANTFQYIDLLSE